jgi:hypothetical protein
MPEQTTTRLRWIHRLDLPAERVKTRRVPSRWRSTPEVEALIDQAWIDAHKRPGVKLFDGPLCRFEGFDLHADEPGSESIRIDVSSTRYRIVVGTHFAHPDIVDRFGPDVAARPIGVSSGVISADGRLLLGVRSERLAYYPGRVHPFAGSMSDLPEPDIVADALREVREELNIAEQEPMSIRMVGLVEDLQMRHPEAIFLVRLPINEQELRTRLDHDEHGEIVSAPLENHALESLRADPRLTPFALGVVEACLERVNSDSLGQT